MDFQQVEKKWTSGINKFYNTLQHKTLQLRDISSKVDIRSGRDGIGSRSGEHGQPVSERKCLQQLVQGTVQRDTVIAAGDPYIVISVI